MLPPPDTSECATEAAASFACEMADLTAWFLGQTGLSFSPDQQVSLPTWYLLELGAALQVFVWERVGVWNPGLGLPTFQEANQTIADRFAAKKGGGTPLFAAVFSVWSTHVTWARSSEIRPPLLIAAREEEEEEFVDLMAQFLLAQVRN